jgi:hypothetical protein
MSCVCFASSGRFLFSIEIRFCVFLRCFSDSGVSPDHLVCGADKRPLLVLAVERPAAGGCPFLLFPQGAIGSITLVGERGASRRPKKQVRNATPIFRKISSFPLRLLPLTNRRVLDRLEWC